MEINRKLMMAILTIAILICIGTIAYQLLEGWSLVDSFYFSATTLLTIGYGEIYPTHDTSKIFTVFYAFIGIGLILYSLALIAQSYFEARIKFHFRFHLPRILERIKRRRKKIE